jgi:predicted nicotinamide N-methyase
MDHLCVANPTHWRYLKIHVKLGVLQSDRDCGAGLGPYFSAYLWVIAIVLALHARRRLKLIGGKRVDLEQLFDLDVD